MTTDGNPEDAFDRLGVALGLTAAGQHGFGSAVWNGDHQLFLMGPAPVEVEGDQS